MIVRNRALLRASKKFGSDSIPPGVVDHREFMVPGLKVTLP